MAKLTGDLTTLLAGTYLGRGGERCYSLLPTDDGGVITCGVVPLDLPTAYRWSYVSPNPGNWDGVLFRLDSELSTLVAATALGGEWQDEIFAACSLPDGNVVVTGRTRSDQYPITPGSFDDSRTGETYDAFVSIIDAYLSWDRLIPVLIMADTHLQPGDTLALDVLITNPGDDLTDVPLFVLLDVFGEYWFWPRWRHYPPDIDWKNVDVPQGSVRIEIIPEFTWPDVGTGLVEGLRFHAALLNEAMTEVLGEVDTVEWSYGP